ncbi:MAG: hypothetical protein JWN75_1212 [Candidatus Saccharibacteria bacterium]|nr:hypothetical protein [Candidatus Saccharibacteria bacterium]
MTRSYPTPWRISASYGDDDRKSIVVDANSTAILNHIDVELATLITFAVNRTDEHGFKNFHQQLCSRFGYVHDEVHWKRDLISLIEHIDTRLAGYKVSAEPGMEIWAKAKKDAKAGDLLPVTITDVKREQPPIDARAAFRAGWFINADTEQPKRYLIACEEVDWKDYLTNLLKQ